ncbi:efflux RND transporter periplasmic adaptor subunit [Flavobacterium faecale]|uniref:efflux RND transporter periplasmic adaptor subunit n=1 Tax=Flavobacterium faecale TaxID=1355330 RepID=UPI003AAB3669
MSKTYFLWMISLCFISFSCKDDHETISPMVTNITESVYAFGIIKSKNQYEVYSKTGGIVENIFIKEGATINKGTPLFQMEQKDVKIATENVRLTANNEALAINRDKLKEAKIQLQLAQKKLINDSLIFARLKKLWQNKIGSQIELEQKEINYENAKASLTAAKLRHDDLERELVLASKISKNNLKIAQFVEDDFIIKSKVDGIVYKINIEQGEQTSNLAPLAIIGENDFEIELRIDEIDIVKIKEGQKVFVRMDSYKSEVYEATITFVYPMMDERTRTFKAEALFTKKPKKLFPNLTLEANIVISTKKNVLTIPRNYLLNDSSVRLENGTIQKIETGLMDYNLVEIKKGLTSSSKIIKAEK